jgi:hypothetical protein
MRTALLLGIVVGLGLGLAYAWLIDPVELLTADPYLVEAPYREAWIVMAAEAYLVSGDWDRTQARLAGLNDPNLKETVGALFDRFNIGEPNPEARALAYLADRLDARTAGMLIYLATPAVSPTPRPSPSPVARVSPTINLTPTSSFSTPTPTSPPPPEFALVSSQSQCLSSGTPQIRVTAQDADGNGLSGVDVWITWDGGADRFVTGLKPEFGSGFGDFDMQPDVSYRVGAGTQSALALVGNLRADACTTEAGEAGRLSWDVVLRPASP